MAVISRNPFVGAAGAAGAGGWSVASSKEPVLKLEGFPMSPGAGAPGKGAQLVGAL
jgi:hypothetical protein